MNERVIDRLIAEHDIERAALIDLIEESRDAIDPRLARAAEDLRDRAYGRRVFFRGLIEFSNACRNDCLYCGIRRSNGGVARYRLSGAQILDCARQGAALGFRSFVLQSGEDMFFTAERLAGIVRGIKDAVPGCAVTLSVGERDRKAYRLWREAGADRYLLRHESATPEHYASLHPPGMALASRMDCLHALRALGYQVGAGCMVGSPGQTAAHLAEDLLFLHRFQPHMIGIGPFLPQADTPFGHEPPGTVAQTLLMLCLARLLVPRALIPATTALATLDPMGREKALAVGANVVMPNLSPLAVRKSYLLYDNKIATDEEAAENAAKLKARIEAAGYEPCLGRGDWEGAAVDADG